MTRNVKNTIIKDSQYSKCIIITQISDILLCSLASVGCIILYTQEDSSSSSSFIALEQSITMYFAFSLSAVINIVQASSSSSILLRSSDKLAVSVAFFIQFLFFIPTVFPDHQLQELTSETLYSFTAVSVCLSTSLLSTFSLPSSTRYISSLAMILFTNVQGTFTLHSSILNSNQDNSPMIPIFFCTHILALLIVYLSTLVIVQIDKKIIVSKVLKSLKVIGSKSKKASNEKLVNNTHDDTMDTEPINFSFYFKDEISDDIKNVMKTIDEMLINESGKPLDDIEEVPEEVPEQVSEYKNDENIYVNVNVMKHPLDDSKLEETEVI